jgi:hypothetical protein
MRPWLALAAMAVASSAAAQDPTAPTFDEPTTVSTSSTYTYDIPLFREDYALSNPTNTWSYFFELRPGVRLVSGNFVELHYTSSSTIIKGQGSITVMLNNVPVASRRLNDGNQGPWRIQLPLNRFKAGFNELRLVTRQRSLDGPCEDLDNRANWVKFDRQTRLHLVREDKPVFPIAAYPFPYLDNLEVNPVRAAIVLPGQPTDRQISEMLELSSDWGRKERIRSIPVRVSTSDSGGPSILLGDAWREPEMGSLGESEGLVKAFSRTGAPGSSKLLVTGSNEAGATRAREALSHPEMVEQVSDYTMRVPIDPADDPTRSTTKIGEFTLTDLGIPQITLSGAFHQKTTITIQRPIRADLGKQSMIKFKFRHSASLNPLRSILSIFLNGVPIASSRLDPGNANDGEFSALIPVEELAKSRWVFEIAAYHDLAAVDCSKTYDDVAWTVIQGASVIELAQGSLNGRPYLDGFPYLINKNGLPPEKVVMSLSQGANETQLSIAGRIAARAAQVNRTPLAWEARTAADPKSTGSAIAIGYFNEVNRWSTLGDALLVAPTANGSFNVNEKINLLPNELENAAVLQAVKMPGADDSVLYVLLASNDAALRRFGQVLNDPEKSIQMTGEVVVITPEGRVVSMSTVGDQQDIRAEQEREKQSYTPQMRLIMGLAIGLVLVFAFFIVNAFRKPSA